MKNLDADGIKSSVRLAVINKFMGLVIEPGLRPEFRRRALTDNEFSKALADAVDHLHRVQAFMVNDRKNQLDARDMQRKKNRAKRQNNRKGLKL